jgi:hypothetical protein
MAKSLYTKVDENLFVPYLCGAYTGILVFRFSIYTFCFNAFLFLDYG